MPTVGVLEVLLRASVGGLVAGLNRAESSIARFRQRFLGLGGLFQGIATSGAVLGFERLLESVDRFGDTAAKIGVGVEGVSRIVSAGREMDISLEDASTAIRILQKNISLAADEGSRSAKIFAALGVDVGQLAKADVDRKMLILAEAFGKVRSQADQVRLAMELMGRGGTTILPLLTQGVQGLEAAFREADASGRTITAEQSRAADLLDKQWQNVKSSISTIARTLLVEVHPVISLILEGLLEIPLAIRTIINEARQLRLNLIEMPWLPQMMRPWAAGAAGRQLFGPGGTAGEQRKIDRESVRILSDLAELQQQMGTGPQSRSSTLILPDKRR
mgnify:FL=1